MHERFKACAKHHFAEPSQKYTYNINRSSVNETMQAKYRYVRKKATIIAQLVFFLSLSFAT